MGVCVRLQIVGRAYHVQYMACGSSDLNFYKGSEETFERARCELSSHALHDICQNMVRPCFLRWSSPIGPSIPLSHSTCL